LGRKTAKTATRHVARQLEAFLGSALAGSMDALLAWDVVTGEIASAAEEVADAVVEGQQHIHHGVEGLLWLADNTNTNIYVYIQPPTFKGYPKWPPTILLA